jgi:preprotein translocase subunit SecB
MADNGNGNNGAAQPEAPQVRMQVLGQYVRDLSFENIVAQKGITNAEVQPDIQVQVSLDARKRAAENQYEVINKFRVTSKNKADQSPLFLLELVPHRRRARRAVAPVPADRMPADGVSVHPPDHL